MYAIRSYYEPWNAGIKIRCLTAWRRPKSGSDSNRLRDEQSPIGMALMKFCGRFSGQTLFGEDTENRRPASGHEDPGSAGGGYLLLDPGDQGIAAYRHLFQIVVQESDDPRITSYNVCYTKLLRNRWWPNG